MTNMGRKLLKISVKLMEQLLREPRLDAISQKGFPADGKIVGVSLASTDISNEPRAILILIIESATFELLAGANLRRKWSCVSEVLVNRLRVISWSLMWKDARV